MGSVIYDPLLDELVLNPVGKSPAAFNGSDCNGNDGDSNRVLDTSVGGIFLVVVNNATLHPTNDYTVSGTEITFLNAIFDDAVISVWHS